MDRLFYCYRSPIGVGLEDMSVTTEYILSVFVIKRAASSYDIQVLRELKQEREMETPSEPPERVQEGGCSPKVGLVSDLAWEVAEPVPDLGDETASSDAPGTPWGAVLPQESEERSLCRSVSNPLVGVCALVTVKEEHNCAMEPVEY